MERLRDVASRYAALNLEIAQREANEQPRYARAKYDAGAKRIYGGAKRSPGVERPLPISPNAMRREADERRLLESLYRQMLAAIDDRAAELGVPNEAVRADVFEFYGLAEARDDAHAPRDIAPDDEFLDVIIRMAVGQAITQRSAAVTSGIGLDLRDDEYIWSHVRAKVRSYLEHSVEGRKSAITDIEVEARLADVLARMETQRAARPSDGPKWSNVDTVTRRARDSAAAKARACELTDGVRTYSAIASIMNDEGYTSPRGGIVRAETVKRWTQRAA